MNKALPDKASDLHHQLGLSFADVESSSRSSMSAHLKKLLKIKSRFSQLSGVRCVALLLTISNLVLRFHQTCSNAQALLIDEIEVELVTKTSVASASAQKIATRCSCRRVEGLQSFRSSP